MSKKLLDDFFKENKDGNKNPSAPALAHFHIKLESKPETLEKIQSKLNEAVFKYQPERKGKSLAERNEIETAATCEQVVKIMRGNTDAANRHILVSKAMEFESEIVPELVSRLKTSANDVFIESAIRVLAKSTINITDVLIGYYDDMRNPYAQSMILVLLGFKADETRIPWFIEKYKKLKKNYPNESYHEGAYYGLIEIGNRYYPQKNK